MQNTCTPPERRSENAGNCQRYQPVKATTEQDEVTKPAEPTNPSHFHEITTPYAIRDMTKRKRERKYLVDFLWYGNQLCPGLTRGRCFYTRERRFKGHFGCSSRICKYLWRLMQMQETLPPKATPFHLLWALLHMKTYDTEEVLCTKCGVVEKTFRKWSWRMMEALFDLDIVSVEYSLHSVCIGYVTTLAN